MMPNSALDQIAIELLNIPSRYTRTGDNDSEALRLVYRDITAMARQLRALAPETITKPDLTVVDAEAFVSRPDCPTCGGTGKQPPEETTNHD